MLIFVIVVFCLVGFVMRKSKIFPLLIGIYIALAVTNEVGLEMYRFLNKSEVGGITWSQFIVKTAIFCFIAFLLFIEGRHISPADDGDNPLMESIQGAVWGAVAGAILFVVVIGYMGAADQATILNKARVVNLLTSKRMWLIIPFPITLAFSSLLKRFK